MQASAVKTVKGIYENGEIRLAEPVDVEGTWYLDINFVEEVKGDEETFESNPHRPEALPIDETYEQLHSKMEGARPTHRPY